jgi:hypothetical protein
LKIGKIYRQKNGKFLKLGVALILRYILADLLLIQAKFALVRPAFVVENGEWVINISVPK